MRLRWLIPPISLMLVLAAIFYFFASSQYPEKAAFYALQKTVSRSGGSLTSDSVTGDIKSGLVLKGVVFRNETALFKAASVKLRMRTTPLLFGIFYIKELSIGNATLWVTQNSNERRGSSDPIPLWLNVVIKDLSSTFDRIEIVRKDGASYVIENSRVNSSAVVKFGRVLFRDLNLGMDRNPLGRPLSFIGSLGAKPGSWVNCHGNFSAGDSKGSLSANYRINKGSTNLDAELTQAVIFLRDFRAVADFPDLELACSAKVAVRGENFELKVEVEEKGYGKFSAEGEAVISDGMIKGKGNLSAKPFYYSLGIPQIKSDRIRINGDFSSGFEYDMKSRKLKCLLEGAIKDSEALNIPVDSGEAKAELDGDTLTVASTFASRKAGKGSIEVTHDLATFLTSVRFSSNGTLSKSTVDALGIEIPLPNPLVFSENLIDIENAELLFDGENVNIDIEASDNKEGRYRVGCFFRKLELSGLNLDLSRVDTGIWGLRSPFLFSGLLDIDLTLPDFTPVKMTGGRFDFEKGSLGPIDTDLRVLPSGKLMIPSTLVPFPGGTAEITAEISESGAFSGRGTATVSSYEILPLGVLPEAEGRVVSSFLFEGDLSKISISGSATSPSFSCARFSGKDVEVKGSVSLAKEDREFHAILTARGISSGPVFLGATTLKIDGTPGALKFDLASLLAGEKEIKLAGVAGTAGEVSTLKIESGVIRTGPKNLYFSGTPEVVLKDGRLAWKNLALLSGESKLFSDGSLYLSEGHSDVDARLALDNFSIVLIPLPKEIESLRGKIDGDITIRGTVDEPDMRGELLFKNLTFPLPESDLKIVGMARLDLEGNTVRFGNCYFSTGDGGDADLKGHMKLRSFLPGEMDISLSARDFPVVYGRDFEALVDSDLRLTGSPAEPHLDGSVHFLKGKIQLPEAVKNPELPSTIVFVNGPERDEALKKKEDDLLERLRGGILFTSAGKLWISRSDMVGELGGRVLVKFTKNGVVPEGSLSVLAGRFLLQGSKFELKDSSLFFSEGKDLYPLLDIKASKEIAGYEVTVKLQGRVEKPTLTLSSIPPLDEGEVLSLILFGRTSQNLNPEEHAAWGGAAAAIAFNYEATPVMRSVSKALKVDTLLVGTSSSGDPQIGFSKYLSDRFVLEYQQTFGSLPETRVNLRYRINRHLSLETISSTAGKSGADLTWEQKY